MKYIEEETVVTAHSWPWHLDRIDQRYLPLDKSFSLFAKTGAGVDIYILDSGWTTLHIIFSAFKFITIHAGIRYTHDEFEGRAKYSGYDPVDDHFGSNQ